MVENVGGLFGDPDELRRRLERACAGPLPELLPRRPPASLTHGDLWTGNVVGGRWFQLSMTWPARPSVT